MIIIKSKGYNYSTAATNQSHPLSSVLNCASRSLLPLVFIKKIALAEVYVHQTNKTLKATHISRRTPNSEPALVLM